MKITGSFSLRLFRVGHFIEQMGHCSHLLIEGINALVEKEGGVLILTQLPRMGQSIASETSGSRITGTITKVMIGTHPGAISIEIDGLAEGKAGSILGGLSCHATWHITEVRLVEGRFGPAVSLEEYEAAKAAHRAEFLTSAGNLTAESRNLATRQGWRLPHEYDPHLRKSGVCISPCQWADAQNPRDLVCQPDEGGGRVPMWACRA